MRNERRVFLRPPQARMVMYDRVSPHTCTHDGKSGFLNVCMDAELLQQKGGVDTGGLGEGLAAQTRQRRRPQRRRQRRWQRRQLNGRRRRRTEQQRERRRRRTVATTTTATATTTATITTATTKTTTTPTVTTTTTTTTAPNNDANDEVGNDEHFPSLGKRPHSRRALLKATSRLSSPIAGMRGDVSSWSGVARRRAPHAPGGHRAVLGLRVPHRARHEWQRGVGWAGLWRMGEGGARPAVGPIGREGRGSIRAALRALERATSG